MDRHTLTIDATQTIFGDFQISHFHGPLADKALCYAILGLARDHVQWIEEAEKVDDKTFRITITIRRGKDELYELDSLTGPPKSTCFVYGILELARDRVREGIRAASKVNIPEG
jgi:hypothetical protein